MMRLPRSVSSSALVLGGVLGLAMTQGGTAEAGHAHFSGSAHVSVGVHGGFRAGASVRFARPIGRPFFRPRVWVGGRWWFNSYWWPRPYYYYYPEYVPSYYGGNYYPVQPGVAAPGAALAVPRRPSLPTFGFGVFAGGTSVNGMKDASEVGLLGRLRLTPGLLLEAEVAKDSFSGDVATCTPGVPCTSGTVGTTSGDRVDRRIGGSLIWEIGPHNSFAPYLLAGGGVQQAKVTSGDFFGSDFTTTQDFGEIGVGLRWALSRSLHLTADIRAGRRQTIDSNQNAVVPVARATTINPPSGGPNDNTEDYTRARLAAVINF
jgi:hypothetical protein